VVVGGQVLDIVRHHLPHLEAHRVPLFRLIEDDPADRAVLVQQELWRLAHGILLVAYWRQIPLSRRVSRRKHLRGGGQSGRGMAATGWERVPLTPTASDRRPTAHFLGVVDSGGSTTSTIIFIG